MTGTALKLQSHGGRVSLSRIRLWTGKFREGGRMYCNYNLSNLSYACNFCWFAPLGASWGELRNWPLHAESKERPQKEAGPSSLVGGRFNKQGDLHTRFVLCGHKMSRFLTSARTLKASLEALAGFSHVHYPDGLSNTSLSQGCILETALL